jgi:hypothetical protein
LRILREHEAELIVLSHFAMGIDRRESAI